MNKFIYRNLFIYLIYTFVFIEPVFSEKLVGKDLVNNDDQSSSCGSEETILHKCSYKNKILLFCASADLGPSSGYLYYKVFQNNKIEFIFPEKQQHPKGLFFYSSLANGSEFKFKNKQYLYIFIDTPNGLKTEIYKSGKMINSFNCLQKKYDPSFTKNSSLDIIKKAKIECLQDNCLNE